MTAYARSSAGRAAVSKTAGRRIEANRAIPSRVYDILKWLGLIVLPALALFVSTVGPAWGWTHVDAIVTVLLQCLFDRFGSVFPQWGLVPFCWTRH